MWKQLGWSVVAGLLVCGTASGQTDGMKMPTASHPPAAQSTELSVTVNGVQSKLSLADLQSMPQKTVKVHNEHTKAEESYSGPSLGDVLAKVGYVPAQSSHRQFLRSFVRAEGTDQYWVLYSLVEVEPSEHTGDVIVATAVDGHGLGADGELKLVSTEDRKPQRWVRNLATITVKPAE